MSRRPHARPNDSARASGGAEDDGGSVQIGPTDQGMVRLIIDTATGVFEMDFPPEEAREIAEEIIASAEVAAGAGKGRRRG